MFQGNGREDLMDFRNRFSNQGEQTKMVSMFIKKSLSVFFAFVLLAGQAVFAEEIAPKALTHLERRLARSASDLSFSF